MKFEMEKPVYGGDCLAHLPSAGGKPGKAVFVPFTLPGESVTAQMVEEKRSFARAELAEVLHRSPGRVAPGCRHFGVCGGCQYQHADSAAQLAWKEQILRETLSRAGLVVPAEMGVIAGKPWQYRNRIRLAIAADGAIGYRSRGSHAIVLIEECPIAAPILVTTALRFAEFLRANPGPVRISELELFTNADESQLLLTLLCEAAADGAEDWLSEVQGALAGLVTGFRLQISDGGLEANVIAGMGDLSLSYSVAGFTYRVDQGAFFQVNRWLVDEFTGLVTGGVSGESAWDLFAGVGLFARQLAGCFSEVVAVESASASRMALSENLTGTTGRAVASSTLEFLRRNRLEREPGPGLIVLDPPRAGLGEETTSLLNAIGAAAMVYVSCDPTTLARDLRALTRERYRMESVTLVDMFPQTFHIETVVRLRRS